jgi:hypothetical protein
MILNYQQADHFSSATPVLALITKETSYAFSYHSQERRLRNFTIHAKRPGSAHFTLALSHREAAELYDELHRALQCPKPMTVKNLDSLKGHSP